MIHFAAAAVLASTLVLYAAVFVDYERLTIPTYHQHIKSIRRRARKNAILYSHTFCGLVEILRWHIRNLWDPTPTADALDMLLCLVQSGTNLALVKNLVRGTPAMTRPSYQAGAIFRPILTFFAWQTANPALHKSSVKALNAFIYCRMLIFFMNTFITQDAMSRATMYNIGVFVSAIVAIGEGAAFTYQMHVYILTVFAVAALNKWVSTQSRNIHKLSKPKQHLIRALEYLSFAELSTIRAYRKGSAALEVDRPDDEWAPTTNTFIFPTKADSIISTVAEAPSVVAVDPIVVKPIEIVSEEKDTKEMRTAPVARLRLVTRRLSEADTRHGGKLVEIAALSPI